MPAVSGAYVVQARHVGHQPAGVLVLWREDDLLDGAAVSFITRPEGPPLMIRLGICNELFEGWEFGEVCRTVKRLGYDGLEIAPFTLAPRITDVTPERRRELRSMVEDAGLATIGLHWLLAKTEGFYLTSPDPAVRRRTAEYLVALAEATRDLGGSCDCLGDRLTVDEAARRGGEHQRHRRAVVGLRLPRRPGR